MIGHRQIGTASPGVESFGNPFRRMPGLVLFLFFVSGCTTSLNQPGDGGSGGNGRTYRMGFSGYPPRFDINLALSAINMWSQRADAAIMSYEPPWDSLLAGTAPESLVVHDELSLARLYRAKGLALWLYLDPENGLNRTSESDALIRHGRSITEPGIQQLYRRYCYVADSILRPDHLGLALETNLIRGAAPDSVYRAIRTVVNDAAADIRGRDSAVLLSVSVQVDYAWGRLTDSVYRGVETDFGDFPFIQELGLSSYPYLAGFTQPEDIPSDYYRRLLNGRKMPVMVTEGGWTSVSLGAIQSSPDKQKRYLTRQMTLLDTASATAVFQLTFTDIDLTANPPPPGSIIGLFAYLGLVDVNLQPKPALAVWDRTFLRPRLRGQ
ncbi:MAG TPA: hypothetical protein VMW43_02385 [Bacteroidota bacterium]|nr:hypothetical protein [Bacteroidota bacterium]